MRALVLLFLLTIATRAGADCENLCDDEWWKTATIDDIKNELDAGIDVMSKIQRESHRCIRLQCTAPKKLSERC